MALQGGSASKLLGSTAPILYVVKNSAVVWLQPDVAGTPTGIPWPHMWDGSLWTLLWELFCYTAIAVLGVVGLLRRRWVIPLLLAAALVWSTQLPGLNTFPEVPLGQQTIDVAAAVLYAKATAARFAVMFLTGALFYQFRDKIPARWPLIAVSVAIVLACSFMPNYRLIGAIPLAYAIIISAALIRNKRLQLHTDLSYGVYIYAFPIQQLLIICGLAFLNPLLLATIAAAATVPLAALSWFLVEKPSMALKGRLKRKEPKGGPIGAPTYHDTPTHRITPL